MEKLNKIDICSFDIDDKVKLALFLNKRAEWIRMISKDTNSLLKQVGDLLWDDALFRTFAQITEYYPENDNPKIGYNPYLFDMIIRNFYETQTLRIRRLTDAFDERSKNSVVSIKALIEDILQNLHIITRENFVCYDGSRYDVSKLLEKYRAKRAGKGAYSVPKDLFIPDGRNKSFDKLSGIEKDARSRNDTIIKQNIMKMLSFKKCDKMRKYVNKFVAHAATDKSIDRIDINEIAPTLEKFDECYREIAKAIWEVNDITGDTIAFQVPTPNNFDQFINLCKPMAKKTDIDKLRDYWDHRCIEIINILD